ncbi:gamma-glutamylcyclotransferase [Neptunicella marina]|uniref:Gamma-glutamylcyclotransferase n=1 Tax=Neptunicella marina TaxID=2125989 RepID=A0A8J6ISH8_9ALTE|nr:gamma-glutamylcyclotransferase [Neptunicella marina]MBC3764786.1 gamma-glutamylcyclotransferase [Neptunicella marina]
MSQYYHYLLGYGSLLSTHSRTQYSQLSEQAEPVTLTGWQRSWITQNPQEKQSHVGAIANVNAAMNGVLIKVPHIDDNLRQREKDYRFSQVATEQITLLSGEPIELDAPVMICESLLILEANSDHPVMQSYVDTCLVGCLEAGGETFARQFIETTCTWNQHWLNDRQNPLYPRRAIATGRQMELIDQLLAESNLLTLRQNTTD